MPIAKRTERYHDIPLHEARHKAQQILMLNRSVDVYQKFTCKGCGARLTMHEPNRFADIGRCEHCNTVTDIKKRGCGYYLHIHTTEEDAL